MRKARVTAFEVTTARGCAEPSSCVRSRFGRSITLLGGIQIDPREEESDGA